MATIPPPVLEVFYASSCAPCRLELPVLAAFNISHNGQLRVVLVADPARGLTDLRAVSPALAATVRRADGKDTRDVLRKAGDTDAILPYARVIASGDAICASWRGTLTITRINNLLTGCARFNVPHLPRS
jgi:thiol-disulfide isomerase/thioredoxin